MIIGVVATINALLFLWAFKGSFGAGEKRSEQDRVFPKWRSMLLSFSVVIAALVIWRIDPASPYKMWVFWGMLLSFFGDLAMAKILRLPDAMIGGMLLFGVAHCFYMIAFITTASVHAETVFNLGLLTASIVYGIALITTWLFFIRNPNRSRVLNTGALIYGLWVCGTACFATGLTYTLGNPWLVAAIGGLLFVVSDLIIAITSIGGRHIRHQGVWVWVTYIAAQLMITYSSLL